MGRGLRTFAGFGVLAGAIASTQTPAAAQTVAAPSAGAKAIASTVLIFDGSGSMWGKLGNEKQQKLDQARDAVRATLGKLAPQSMQLGLMSFGHRRAS